MGAGRPPIFVVGFPRSGTTLLQAMLGGHSRIAAAPEMHYWLRLYHLRDYWGSLEDDTNLERALAELIDLPLGMLAGAGFSFDRLLPRLRSGERTYRSLLEVTLDDLAARQGKQRWSEKTPGQTAVEVWGLFPEAQVVHIVRDPRNTVASILEMPFNHEPSWGVARRLTAFTLDNVRAGAERGPAQFLQIRYEDLARNPAATMRLVFSFLEEPFEEAALSDAGRRSATAVLGGALVWQARSFDQLSEPSPDEWRTRMSRRDWWRASTLVAPWLEPFGYPPAHRRTLMAGVAMLAATGPAALVTAARSRRVARRTVTPEARHQAVQELIRTLTGSITPAVGSAFGHLESEGNPPAVSAEG